MGRTALLLVMGLGMAMGIISYNISGTTERALETNYTYYKYMYARNLARSAIHAGLRSYDNGNVTPDTVNSTPFAYGSFRVLSAYQSASPGDTLWMRARGTYADTNYTIYVTLFKTTKPYPAVNSALGVLATLSEFKMNGKPRVDGRNYNATGTALVGSGDLPGVTVLNNSDSTTVYSRAITASKDTLIRGVVQGGVTQRVIVDRDPEDPSAFIEEYENNYDYYRGPGTYSNESFGTSSNPVILFCSAPDSGTQVKFSGTTTGYGILAVRGNLSLAGQFSWYGLIVVLGVQNTVEFDESGNAQIVGGLIVASKNYGPASLKLNGTGANPGKILYSSDAISNSTNVGRLRYYKVIDWWEGI
jgi:hypothetical protein